MKLVPHPAAAPDASEPDTDGRPFAIAVAVLGPAAVVLTLAMLLALVQ